MNVAFYANAIFNSMKNFTYGYIGADRHLHKEINNTYIFQPLSVIQKTLVGTCFEQVEYERFCFTSACIRHIVIYLQQNLIYHTFLVFFNNNYYWFEHALESFKGIHMYDTLYSLVFDVISKVAITDDKVLLYLVTSPPSPNLKFDDLIKFYKSNPFLDIKQQQKYLQ